jgi:hypothetical protein
MYVCIWVAKVDNDLKPKGFTKTKSLRVDLILTRGVYRVLIIL